MRNTTTTRRAGRAIAPLMLVSLTVMSGVPGLLHAQSPIAEVICDSPDRMRDRLERRNGAAPRAIGLRGPDELVELWTDPRGDWTMVITYAEGRSCIVAMGEDWQSFEQDPA
ncbi:hypothetical protein [Pseudooceanicola nanhaiensis]|uniref:hypothetical protein n=1 Tax=Pseudooceanicola nanhaiensis TaxID=375761 RepID=UPI001CD41EBD|nr:hypothetical protein [Pseudooceanicola nanhaiensis]MCA0922423.1 hypothetical protein [Pseudooceanicola nanhaiensis]